MRTFLRDITSRETRWVLKILAIAWHVLAMLIP